jgi:hypothetical protein
VSIALLAGGRREVLQQLVDAFRTLSSGLSAG